MKQVDLASKINIARFIKKTDFHKIFNKINLKVTANKRKYIKAKKELDKLSEKVKSISTKGHDFLLGRIYFTVGDGYQFFFSFCPNA